MFSLPESIRSRVWRDRVLRPGSIHPRAAGRNAGESQPQAQPRYAVARVVTRQGLRRIIAAAGSARDPRDIHAVGQGRAPPSLHVEEVESHTAGRRQIETKEDLVAERIGPRWMELEARRHRRLEECFEAVVDETVLRRKVHGHPVLTEISGPNRPWTQILPTIERAQQARCIRFGNGERHSAPPQNRDLPGQTDRGGRFERRRDAEGAFDPFRRRTQRHLLERGRLPCPRGIERPVGTAQRSLPYLDPVPLRPGRDGQRVDEAVLPRAIGLQRRAIEAHPSLAVLPLRPDRVRNHFRFQPEAHLQSAARRRCHERSQFDRQLAVDPQRDREALPRIPAARAFEQQRRAVEAVGKPFRIQVEPQLRGSPPGDLSAGRRAIEPGSGGEIGHLVPGGRCTRLGDGHGKLQPIGISQRGERNGDPQRVASGRQGGFG